MPKRYEMQVNHLLCKLLAELTVVYDQLKNKVMVLAYYFMAAVPGSVKVETKLAWKFILSRNPNSSSPAK